MNILKGVLLSAVMAFGIGAVSAPASANSVGCTLTPGFWKNHVDAWPTPPVPNEPFFGGEYSYLQVLHTAPRGNPYFILAHAYIAAQLNVSSGASAGLVVIQNMLNSNSIFNSFGPYDPMTKDERDWAISIALVLDSYNNGVIGPGACADD